MIAKLIIDCINVIFLSLAILICVAVLVLTFLRIRPLISNVPILLTCNTYISLCFLNIMFLIINAYHLYGDLNPSVSVNDTWWCQFRAYLTYSAYGMLYYSCLLQAIFRFFRVKFYRRKILQSSSFFIIAIIIQWIISFLISLYNYLSDDYEYMPFEYRCWLSFTDILGLSYAMVAIYLIPLPIIMIIYRYLILHIRQTNPLQRRRISNERDVLVLKRIVMCCMAICVLGIPTTIIWFVYIVSRFLIPLAYHIQGLSLVMGHFIVSVCFIFVSPQIQEIFTKNRQRVLPMATQRNDRNTMTITTQQRQEERH